MVPTGKEVLILAVVREERERTARRERMLKLRPQPVRGIDRLVRFARCWIGKTIEPSAVRSQDRIRVDGLSKSGEILTGGANHG